MYLPRARRSLLVLGVLVIALVLTACGGDSPPQASDADGPITVYSGRSEELVGSIIAAFEQETGIEVRVRYGDTAEMAAQILEEGRNTPADVYFAQDAGALGALAREGLLADLPSNLLELVDPRFRSRDDDWVGISGRARTLVYNTSRLSPDELPDSVLELTGPEWQGRLGWAPTNGSFQAFVTGMRVELGEDVTRQWVEAILANGVRSYEKNTAIVDAVARGEVDAGLVNHYYLYQFLAEDPSLPVENAFLTGDIGALVNIAGVAILETTDQPEAARRFLEFLLSPQAQEYFSTETYEYPLVDGVDRDPRLPSLDEINPPDLDLSDLEDLRGTLDLLRETGALQ